MRYEAVVLSGGEETDYSSGEETPSHPPPLPPPPEVSPSLSCHTASFTVSLSFGRKQRPESKGLFIIL